MTAAELPILYPTVPGKVRGIIGWNPLRLQCQDCGTIHEQCGRSVATCATLAGFQFHLCEENAPRRCPDCLVRVLSECESSRCADQLREARSKADRGAA